MKKHFFKKITSVILTSALAFTMMVPVYADNSVTKVEPYLATATEVVEQYYLNKDLNETNDFSTNVTEEAEILLDAKIELGQTQRETLDLEYADYTISILPFEESSWIISEDEITLSLQVIRTWYYTDQKTTVSEVIDVTLASSGGGGYVVTECYERYDNLTLGPIDRLYQEELASATVLSTSNTIDSFLDDYKADFETQCIEKKAQMDADALTADSTIDKTVAIETRGATTLSRSSIASWARNNYSKSSPSSGGSSVPYYDFSKVSGYYDYTNFASHALLAGGATPKDSGASGVTGNSYWYYRSTSNRSNSWVLGNHFKSFLTRSSPSSSNIGPYGTVMTYNYANTYAGDIIQGYNGSSYEYTLVATYFTSSNVYATGRASSSVYYDNVLAESAWGTIRLIHLQGNYN